jgi:hypothetical protein
LTITGVPGAGSRLPDAARVSGADGEGLFHHHGNAPEGAGFHDGGVVEGGGEGGYGLGLYRVEHAVQIRVEGRGGQVELFRVPGGKRRIGFEDRDNHDVPPGCGGGQETRDVAVNQTGERQAQGRGRGWRLSGCEHGYQQQRTGAEHVVHGSRKDGAATVGVRNRQALTG